MDALLGERQHLAAQWTPPTGGPTVPASSSAQHPVGHSSTQSPSLAAGAAFAQKLSRPSVSSM